MRNLFLIPAVAIGLALPAAAEESLMEKGARQFLEGLLKEMEPALEDLQGLAEEMEPSLREFSNRLGPALADLMGKVDDLSLYELPEMLDNGDIIIRRKPDAKPLEPKPDTPEAEEIEI